MDNSLKCAECSKSFEGSRKTYADLAYCASCRKLHSKDILEIVNAESFTVYDSSKTAEAEAALREFSAVLRLDLHKTLDTLPDHTVLPATACCVSYVGQLTATRIQAREEIQGRIRSGQLLFGALVFARGSRKDPEGMNKFTAVGSKAWFNQLVKGENPIFFDDSDDHVLSVESVGVRSILHLFENNLLLEIEDAIQPSDDSDSLFE